MVLVNLNQQQVDDLNDTMGVKPVPAKLETIAKSPAILAEVAVT
jgi:hypothetical protein